MISTQRLLSLEGASIEAWSRKLLDQVRDAVRLKHDSYRTEQSYVGWIRRYILFHGKKYPQAMGYAEVEVFLTSWAVERNVSANCHHWASIGFISGQ